MTDDTGTGFVHTAPGHGIDDFEIWMKNKKNLDEKILIALSHTQ